MTWQPSRGGLLGLLGAIALAGCSGTAEKGPAADDWRGLLAAGDAAGAEGALRRALDRGESPADLAPWLGEAELRQGNLQEAEYWLTGGEFSPKAAAHGFHMLGRLRTRQGDLSAAGLAFDRALGAGSSDPELWVDIGRMRWQGGEQVEAVAAAERAFELGPDSPASLLLRAQLLRDAQGNDAALPLLERGLALAPNDVDLLAEHAATLGELGRARDMLAATRRLAQVVPRDPRVLWLQAVLAARAGRYDLARILLQRGSAKSEQKTPAAMLLLAIIDLENGNHAIAAQGLDVLARRQPDNARVQALLARALYLGGNFRELVARFGGDKPPAYIAELVGRSYEALGDRTRAAIFLDRAKDTRAMRIISLVGEGGGITSQVRNLIGQGGTEEARAKAGAFLARHPGSVDALALAGDAALAAGDNRAALGYYRKAASVRRSWSLTQRIVAARDRIGDSTAATALLADHLRGEPNNADASATLGRRLMDDGDDLRGRALVDHAWSRGRNDPVLERLLEG
ncbi:tetratricopeptide repeat protein [Tsuneonella sp. HG094]